MQLSREALKQVVQSLRESRSKIYDIEPDSLVQYIKLKANLIKQGYFITDEMLDLPLDQIVSLLERQSRINVEDNTREADEQILDKLLNLDTSIFDNERGKVRQGLLASKTQVEILQTGKQFSVVWGTTMQRCKVSIPVDWDIILPQSLLLDLYDKTFRDHVNPITLDHTFDFVTAMVRKFKDYALVRKALDLDELAGHKVEYSDVSQFTFKRLEEKGLKPKAALVIAILVENYRLKKLPKEMIMETIGNAPHRNRLRRLTERFL